MKRYTEGIDSSTGEYFYRDKPKKKPDTAFYFCCYSDIKTQIGGLVNDLYFVRVERMVAALKELLELGVLPENQKRKLERLIENKVRQYISRTKKQLCQKLKTNDTQ